MMTGNLGDIFGIRYLFVTPEYLNEVSFVSFFFVGFAFGGFFMTWNLTTYLLDAYHFPFLASLSRPFTKFCLNNSLIPLFFISSYLFYTIYFLSYYEFWEPWAIFEHCLGFAFGMTVMVVLTSIYFTFTNKDISNLIKIKNQPPPNLVRDAVPGRRKRGIKLQGLMSGRNTWRIDTYLNESLKPRLVRSVAHYDAKILLSVFKQNHFNALVVQLFGLLTLVVLGLLIDNPYFQIPAASSVFILSSVFVAVAGAITYWFDRWRLTVFVLILIGINFLTSYDIFNHKNKAYGLDYQVQPSEYNYNNLLDFIQPEVVEKDKAATIQILNNWKDKEKAGGQTKPKMVVLCVSGGGMKAAVWSMQVLQRSDSLMGGNLYPHIALITGASGGMIGTAYMRELMLKKQLGQQINLYSQQYIDSVSNDLLNSLAFTIVANDLFMPWLEFEIQGKKYRKDRGYIFERKLNENTGYHFQKTISDYAPLEQQATIPLMFITPAIVNDGRRMIISPQGVSYMSIAPIGIDDPTKLEIDAVDFRKLFANQDADSLRFSTALRMNATYPYILPNVYLPTKPEIEVMDAGFRDNYGILSATRFIHVFKDWIEENTSGVVMIQITSQDKFNELDSDDNEGLIESMFNPLEIVSQIMTLQDYEHDNSLGFIYDILGPERFEIIRFVYNPTKDNRRASMTFHLTQREKEDILNAFYLPENQESLQRLRQVMGKQTVKNQH